MNLDYLEEQVLRSAQREMSPSAQDASRVRTAVVAQIGLAAMGSTVTITGTSAAAGATGTLVSTGVAKVVLVSVLAVGGTATGWVVQRHLPLAERWPAHPVPSAVSVSATHRAAPQPLQATAVHTTDGSERVPGAKDRTEILRPPARHANTASAAAVRPASTSDSAERERLGQEVWLLKQADHALRNHEPEVALKQLNELAAMAPNGTLIEEREAVCTLAQCITSPAEPARQAAYRFLQQYPTSVYAARIRVSCTPTQASGDGSPRARTLPKEEEFPR